MQIDNYMVDVRPLGSGSFATVHRAVDTETGKEVAMKVYLPAHMRSRPHREAARREIRAQNNLLHENIVKILDYSLPMPSNESDNESIPQKANYVVL